MRCKPGFLPTSPLCSLCDVGYVKNARDCIACAKPDWTLLAGVLILFGVASGSIAYLATSSSPMSQKFRCYMDNTAVWAHAKILISFIMVACTVNTQFGVIWPVSFLKALDALSMLSFDFGVIASMFCVAKMDFYDVLLVKTLFLGIG
jgi:hypothetical protein